MSVLVGQGAAFHITDVSRSSWLAFGYLILFGSLVGFTSYVFLLAVSMNEYIDPRSRLARAGAGG